MMKLKDLMSKVDVTIYKDFDKNNLLNKNVECFVYWYYKYMNNSLKRKTMQAFDKRDFNELKECYKQIDFKTWPHITVDCPEFGPIGCIQLNAETIKFIDEHDCARS